MKRQCFRRIASALLAVVLFASSMAIPSEVDAAVTAKSVIKKAVAELEAAESISGIEESIRNGYLGDNKADTFYWHNIGSFVDDGELSYNIWLSLGQGGDGLQEYTYKDKVFQKSYYESEWSAHTDTDYNKKNPTDWTLKASVTYLLNNLIKPKIKQKDDYYIITGKLPKGYSKYKSVSINIDKKTNRVTNVKFTYGKKENMYFNGTDTYTVTGGTFTISYISYGECKVELPDELEGL